MDRHHASVTLALAKRPLRVRCGDGDLDPTHVTQRRAGAAVAVLSMALSALVLLYATAVLTATGQALDTDRKSVV